MAEVLLILIVFFGGRLYLHFRDRSEAHPDSEPLEDLIGVFHSLLRTYIWVLLFAGALCVNTVPGAVLYGAGTLFLLLWDVLRRQHSR